ncbi:DUF262 domain-containing HNH endonuclease family protein [bacterium]|nr:DUF262 domain-containing HNH endonuclease family protein [bacterium]
MSNQESVKIESKDLSIEDLFKDFYTVPDFQREYVWERDHVEKLLQDVNDEFYDEEGTLIKGPEYFLGSIVVCKDEDSIYNLIDGQQRMTTIYLVLCAIRDLLCEMEEAPNNTLLSQIEFASTNEFGDETFKHRLTLQYDDSKGVLIKIVDDPKQLDQIPDKTTSVIRIRSAYHDILEFLRVNFDTSPKKLKLFYATFTKRVKLIRIITPSLANALKVFETVNDRGVGLNAMDLLKNLLFMKTSSDQYPTLKQHWKNLIDILDGCNEKPLRFLRYYIMSHFKLDSSKPLREDEIYTWFTDNSKLAGLDDRPMEFLKTLIDCATAWSNFLGSKDVDGNANPYLKNLSILSGAARQHFILLLAGRHLQKTEFSRLCQSIESLFFCYIVTREATRIFERNFAIWSEDLRGVMDADSLDTFIQNRFTPDLLKRRPAFDFAFNELTQHRIQQYRMRYILAKLTQYIEKQAWSNPAHDSLDQYIASTVEVEHILPETPKEVVKENFDRKDLYFEYAAKLGNLTLLEKTINASVSNDLFALKIPGYKQSAYLLTRSLAEKPNVGINTQLNRAVEHLIAFTELISKSIERRQRMLARLAVFVWDMPGERMLPDDESDFTEDLS